MGDSSQSGEEVPTPGLDPHRDARAVVRLLQCSQCSRPLKLPITLPCGNSLCSSCLPALHLRQNISYPDTPSRRQGFTCPFDGCQQEHSMGDCSPDVTLSKVLGAISHEIVAFRLAALNAPALLGGGLNGWEDPSIISEKSAFQDPYIGRLVTTFKSIEMGELAYNTDIEYKSSFATDGSQRAFDVAVMDEIKRAIQPDLECLVCYALLLDPLTTACGHTFCRQCLHRVLDHSNHCPICRRTLSLPPSLSQEPSNKRLSDILTGLCPTQLAARAELAIQEGRSNAGELDTPLFICTISYPAMPTFLHVFEPRYRLMMRRAVETGDGKFGMILYNQYGSEQGDLGVTSFMQYGTLLHITNMQLLPDGRSLIKSIGVSRFKVRDSGMLDGYTVGRVERIDDVSIAEEERLEALETRQPAAPAHDIAGQLDRLPTAELFNICKSFIIRMQARSTPWLHESVLAAYGNPPEDPAIFPYWLASILSISDSEKYLLIPTTTVRQRLKLAAQWVKQIEAQQW
ncbi:MAG: hypothetical protein M1829_005979 [Trizodia sp. TS-e1964]|nr:MAG: hypothetical protein M1829_005979 [Trizodia sp. TS-e1964]